MTSATNKPSLGFASTYNFPILRLDLCCPAVPGEVRRQQLDFGGCPHVKTNLLSALSVLMALSGFAGTAIAATGHTLPAKNTATYYADRFEGRRTANNERFKQDGLTAAHKTLPFGTRVKVTNLKTDRSVIVKINDRIPPHSNSSIDLTKRAAKELGFFREGRVDVRLKILE